MAKAKFKSKRYDEGGVTEGQNANIDDDTRARAMKFVQEQSEKADSEEPEVKTKTVTKVTKAKAEPKAAERKGASVDDEAGKSRGRPAEGEPKTTSGVTRTRTREETIAAIPTGGKKGAGPTPGNGNSVDSTELSRNASAFANAATPGLSKAVKGATATVKGVRELVASRKAGAAAQAAREAREAKTLNPAAWMAGPKGMKENFKSGGGVKGWGIARGSRKAKTY